MEGVLHLNGILVSILAATLCLLFYYFSGPHHRHHLPPSPPGSIPYFGHLAHVSDPVKFRKNLLRWGKLFDDIFMIRVGPRRIIFLNSDKAITELYGKRGGIYSSRPLDAITSAFFSEKSTAFTPYGKMHRYARTLIGETFGPGPSTSSFAHGLIELQARDLIKRIQTQGHSPEFDLGEEIGRASISTIWAMIFSGEAIDPDRVPDICNALRGFSKVAGVGSRIVSLFPFLGKLGVQDVDIKAALAARQRLIDLISPRYRLALDRVRKERMIEAGKDLTEPLDMLEQASHARRVAEAQLDGEIDEERAIWLIVGLLSASIDTTGSTLHFTLSFIAENKDVQFKAHKLLDEVVGQDPHIPPSFSNSGLDYIRAIIKESTRIWPVSPTGMPRSTDSDDWYNGYFIPKGSTIFMNLRHIQLSGDNFDQPEQFEPDRWLRSEATLSLVDGVRPFGTGRRLCPGIYIATEVMYMLTAHILWAFRISHEKSDEQIGGTIDDPGFGSVIVGPAQAALKFETRLKVQM